MIVVICWCLSYGGIIMISQASVRNVGNGGESAAESALDLPPLSVTVALSDLYRRIAFHTALGEDEMPPSRP